MIENFGRFLFEKDFLHKVYVLKLLLMTAVTLPKLLPVHRTHDDIAGSADDHNVLTELLDGDLSEEESAGPTAVLHEQFGVGHELLGVLQRTTSRSFELC
jgi:hypothetical protein